MILLVFINQVLENKSISKRKKMNLPLDGEQVVFYQENSQLRIHVFKKLRRIYMFLNGITYWKVRMCKNVGFVPYLAC